MAALNDTLVRTFGWRATLLQGDPTVGDRWRWLRRYLRPGPLRTLDAGCGSGAYTLAAARLGNEVLGVSFDQDQLAAARRRAELLGLAANATFVRGDLRRLDEFGASLGTFDQVILCEVIEHILDDAKLLRDVAARLRPGGLLLLTTPYDGHRPLWGERVSEVEDGGHVRFGYSHDRLRTLAAGAGLEIEAVDYISGVVSQKVAELTFALRRFNAKAAWAATLPLRALGPLDGPLTRLTGYPGLSIGVALRRPAAAGTSAQRPVAEATP